MFPDHSYKEMWTDATVTTLQAGFLKKPPPILDTSERHHYYYYYYYQHWQDSLMKLALSSAVPVCFLPPEIRKSIHCDWHFEDKFDKPGTFHLLCMCTLELVRLAARTWKRVRVFVVSTKNKLCSHNGVALSLATLSALSLTRVYPKVWHDPHPSPLLLFDPCSSVIRYPLPSSVCKRGSAASPDSCSWMLFYCETGKMWN